MEKYVKWDDPSNGLNPFTPLETKVQYEKGIMLYLRGLLSIFLTILRLPCIWLVLWVQFFLHLCKYLVILPVLVRILEKSIDSMCGKILVSVSSFNNVKEVYHKDDKEFDFIKSQKGEVTVKVLPGDVYICNQTCFVDWMYLLQTISPIFTKIVIVELANGETRTGLKALGALESIKYALGVRFPEIVT